LTLEAASLDLERVTLASERVLPLRAVAEDAAPYFSMILVYKGAEDWIADLTGVRR